MFSLFCDDRYGGYGSRIRISTDQAPGMDGFQSDKYDKNVTSERLRPNFDKFKKIFLKIYLLS